MLKPKRAKTIINAIIGLPVALSSVLIATCLCGTADLFSGYTGSTGSTGTVLLPGTSGSSPTVTNPVPLAAY